MLRPAIKPQLPSDLLAELQSAFSLFDTENKRVLDSRELKAAMRALGFADCSKNDVRKLLSSIGKTDRDTVIFDEFTDMLASKMLQTRGSREEVMRIFKLFDEDKKGAISFKQLKRVAMELGETLNDDELQEMIEEADRDGDGVLNFDEFYRVMRRDKDFQDDDSDD